MSDPKTYRWGFAGLLIAITAAMAWTVWAFAGAILWAVVLAVVFDPLKDWLLRHLPGRTRTAAVLTLLIIASGLIIPTLLLIALLANEAIGLAMRLQAGHIDPDGLFSQLFQHLPSWAKNAMDSAGIGDLTALTQRAVSNFQNILREIASRAFAVGSDVIGLLLSLGVTLYLTYVLLVDGPHIATRAAEVVPFEPRRLHLLAENFIAVVRATVKGSIVVAFVQGAVGGVIMAFLGVPEALIWGVVMMMSALLPAVGTGLVWVPVSLYLLATGQIWQGIVMALAGALVIGSIDNVLRPILVGRATKMPGALMFLTTLGGLSAFGINGLLLGPIIASLFLATWQMVRDDQ